MTEASAVLSFTGAIIGFSFGWSSLAADYSCNLPEDTPTYKVFGLTYLGLIIPQIGLELLGAAAMATFNSKPNWGAHYEAEGVGGLLAGGSQVSHGFRRRALIEDKYYLQLLWSTT